MSLRSIWKMRFLRQTGAFVQLWLQLRTWSTTLTARPGCGFSGLGEARGKPEEKGRKCDRWWQDVDFSTNPHFLWRAGILSCQSPLWSPEGGWHYEKRQRGGGRQRCASGEGSAHFETEVRDLAEARFAFRGGRPHSIWTFQNCFFFRRPTSEHPPSSFAISALIRLSPDKMKYLYSLRIVTVLLYLLQAGTGNKSLLIILRRYVFCDVECCA